MRYRWRDSDPKVVQALVLHLLPHLGIGWRQVVVSNAIELARLSLVLGVLQVVLIVPRLARANTALVMLAPFTLLLRLD